MSKKSLLDVAYDVISSINEPITFQNLWVKVNEKEGLDSTDMEGKIGKFYTALLTDGRFVNLGDNTWDLRSKYTFDKVHIDMSDCYTEEDEESDPEEKDYEDNLFEEKEEEEDEESEYEPEADSNEDL